MQYLSLAGLVLASCASDDYTRLYHTLELAPGLEADTVRALEFLGPTIVDRGTNFGVYSAGAERVELLVFEDPESARPTQQFAMARFGDVWNLYVEGVGAGQHYGYVAWGPNWIYDPAFTPGSLLGFSADVDASGNRFNPNKLLVDPYAKAVHRDHDWSRGSAASGPHRNQSTYAAAAKSVVVDSKYAWQDGAWREARQSGEHRGHRPGDVVVYEVHLKGITANAASRRLGVENPGTYRGLGEAAAYLQDLGITAVELLPVHEKSFPDGGYWGYNNLSFFAPEVGYSAAHARGGQPVETIDEFKWMVDQLHLHDVEVWIDVVYNHTGEGGLWRTKLFYEDPGGDYICDPAQAVNLDSQEVASLYSFRGLDNAGYYVLADANQGFWSGSTGVGNQVRANHLPMRRLILDSLHYAVEELHVDGFRFDLASVLGEPDGEPSQFWSDASGTVLQEIIDDPVLQKFNTRLVAEPWAIAYDASTRFPVSTTNPDHAWAEWNANFRDWWRTFLNDDAFPLNGVQGLDGGGVITGSYDRYAPSGRGPIHSVNLLTSHDGFTLFDAFSFAEKENGCGPLNPICCEDACSAFCDPTSGDDHGHSRVWATEHEKRQMMRNAFVGLLTSHGTPMLLGGDEWMRTQYGNNNAYTAWSDNEWNWFRWGEWTSDNANNVFRHRMHDFVRDLIRFRKEHTYALAPEVYGGGMPFSWKDANNAQASAATWSGRHIQLHYYDDDAGTDPELDLLINLEEEPIAFRLPEGRSWAAVIDTQAYYDLPGTADEPEGFFSDTPTADPFASANTWLEAPRAISGATFLVQPRSIVILEEQL